MTQPAPPALFASYSPLLGGAERVLIDCATGMDSAVACPDGPLAAAAREAGLTVLPLSAQPLEFRRGPRDRLAAAPRIAAQARELRGILGRLAPAVVFGWNMRGMLASALAVCSLPHRPILVFGHNDFLPPGPALRGTLRAVSRLSARVLCLSRAIAADFDPDGRLAARVRVIHPGVDLARFTPGVASAGAQALVLGAIVGWKRPDFALEITALAARDLPDLRLRLAGGPHDGPGRLLLEQLRSRAGRADLRGRVDIDGPLADPSGALRRAGCLLHCADREPFGLALVEALASGVPVIAPDAGGPREIVDSSCGVLYPPGDAAGAAAALRDVLSSPTRRAELSAGARARAERLFDRERTRAAYRELVAELTG
jgi:glycosyltransferase involved in cell wall biosynthesis